MGASFCSGQLVYAVWSHQLCTAPEVVTRGSVVLLERTANHIAQIQIAWHLRLWSSMVGDRAGKYWTGMRRCVENVLSGHWLTRSTGPTDTFLLVLGRRAFIIIGSCTHKKNYVLENNRLWILTPRYMGRANSCSLHPSRNLTATTMYTAHTHTGTERRER